MRRILIAVTALALVLTGCGGAADDVAGEEPGAPGTASPSVPDDGTLPPPEVPGTGTGETPGERPEPTRVEPTPGMADVYTRPWEDATVVEDGMAVDVFFWKGVAPCYVIDRVEVEETDETVTITLYEGHVPSDEPQACIEIAEWSVVRVQLEEPVGDRSLVDGAA